MVMLLCSVWTSNVLWSARGLSKNKELRAGAKLSRDEQVAVPVSVQAWFGGEAKSKVYARSKRIQFETGDLRVLNRTFS